MLRVGAILLLAIGAADGYSTSFLLPMGHQAASTSMNRAGRSLLHGNFASSPRGMSSLRMQMQSSSTAKDIMVNPDMAWEQAGMGDFSLLSQLVMSGNVKLQRPAPLSETVSLSYKIITSPVKCTADLRRETRTHPAKRKKRRCHHIRRWIARLTHSNFLCVQYVCGGKPLECKKPVGLSNLMQYWGSACIGELIHVFLHCECNRSVSIETKLLSAEGLGLRVQASIQIDDIAHKTYAGLIPLILADSPRLWCPCPQRSGS